MRHLNATVQLLRCAPDLLFKEEDKCYIDERAVFKHEGKDCILLKSGDFLALPQRLVDCYGSFLIAGLSESQKPFKCKCNIGSLLNLYLKD